MRVLAAEKLGLTEVPVIVLSHLSESQRRALVIADRSDKYSEYAHDIHRSGQFLLDVINDILDMSKIEAGRMQLETEVAPLGTIFDEVMRLVGPRAQQGRVDIMRDIPAGTVNHRRSPRPEAGVHQSAFQCCQIHARRRRCENCGVD